MRPQWLAQSQESAELEALQTDVMRFIAILGLCLAAIFSLVHSAALEQAAAREQGTTEEITPPIEPEPVAIAPPKKVSAPTRALRPEPVEEIVTVHESSPAPPAADVREPTPTADPEIRPRDRATEQTVENQPPPPETKVETTNAVAESPAQPGFTLEFASAATLQSLLEGGRVKLYARLQKGFWLADSRGRFVGASAPNRYYRMEADTVPGGLRNSLAAVAGENKPDWGVTLPSNTVQQIEQLMSSAEGGQLVINLDGSITLESAASL